MKNRSARSRSLSRLHSQYDAVLPRIVRHAKVYFRWIKCYHSKADKVQEVRGLCWKWIRQLHRAGKQWWCFVSRLADYACRAVKSGRKVAGTISAKDILNELTQTRRGFCVGKLPDFSTESSNPLTEALADNTVSEVPDQVHFRLDFPAWLATRTEQDRRLIPEMALGHRTKDLARKFGKSEGRISQLRREYHEDWSRFCGDGDE